MYRLAILASHPIQYQAPLFRHLAHQNDLIIKVFFCSNHGVKKSIDTQFGVSFAWDVPLLDGYDHEFLENHSKNPDPQQIGGIYNPGAVEKILEFRPDAVMVHGYSHWTERFVIDQMYKKGVPIFSRGDSSLLQKRPLYILVAKEIYLRIFFRKISAFLSVGSCNTEYYLQYGVPKGKIFLSPFAVDNDYFQSRACEALREAERLRKELKIFDRLAVLFCAKFIPKKRPLELIDAFYRSGIYKDCVLVFAGDGELKPIIEKRIEELGIGSSVRFLGFRNQSEMPATYSLGDLFVIPSSIEPWGLAVNEAMNLGLPVVASDMVSSCRDLIVHGDNGWIYPSGAVEQLATCLVDAATLGRVGLREKGRRSLERISKWGIPETTAGIKKALKDVVNNS